MIQVLRFFATSVVFIALAPAALAQFTIPTTCTGIAGQTIQVASPGSGSITVGNLTKYNVPAQVCTGGTINVPSGFNFSYTAALTFNNVTSTCAGFNWKVNGGPAYVYFTGAGTLSLTGQSSISGQGYYQYDNLTVTVNSAVFQVSSGIIQGRYQNISNGTTVQSTFYVPRGGFPLTVNGQTFYLTADLYRCLNDDPSVTIVQE